MTSHPTIIRLTKPCLGCGKRHTYRLQTRYIQHNAVTLVYCLVKSCRLMKSAEQLTLREKVLS